MLCTVTGLKTSHNIQIYTFTYNYSLTHICYKGCLHDAIEALSYRMEDNEETENIAIGIDLGTTSCCMAVFHNNTVEIIPNTYGGNYTPSYVYIGEDGEKVGLAAKEESFQSPDRTYYNIKRLIGLSCNDETVQASVQRLPFKVLNFRNVPKLIINGDYCHPEQITAKLLYHLRKQAEKYLRRKITETVIAVPVHFNEGQRQATKDSAAIAGFKNIRVINDSTATAISYCHQKCPSRKETILIFDLGGSFLDVAVATVENQNIKIVAVGGDTNLGGDEIDRSILEWCNQKLKLNLENGTRTCFTNERIQAWKKLQILRDQCENVKINLSDSQFDSLQLNFLHNERIVISRDNLDTLNIKLYQKCINSIDQVITDANISKGEIDEIILVGGSSKTPQLRQMISEYFGGKPLYSQLNEDQAVARGSAIAANSIFGGKQNNISFRDVVSVPIGIQLIQPGTNVRYFQPVIRKNFKLPCSKFICSKTRESGQVPVFIIRQGHDFDDVYKNYLIGEFHGENLPLKFPQGTNFFLTLHVNEEGMVDLEAMYETKFKSGKIQLKRMNSSRLSLGDVVRLRITELCLT
ncbi:unnamed protein product [Allacma fusca]|uniref:Heat shock protein 70 n=1 Tax=Allacma fusca TaxID=39272 RepID=A0A8J2KRM0_9HEXA|nr:unnamed protein product [Allacma fusca]